MPRTLPRSHPRSPEGFEAFYKDVRGRLLLQTYALTGDLVAAQRAVRDAMVVAWHHWRKVSRLELPEDYVRPLAWTRAQRRSSARWWARQKDIDAETRATLDALGKLSTTQRKVLLLTHLTALPIDDMAREVGVTRATAERELQTASAQFAVHREVPSTAIRGVLEALAPGLESVRWPRPSIVMRAGSARRRAHTAVGVATAVAAVLVSGSLVTDAAGARPALATKGILDGTPPARAEGDAAPAARPADPGGAARRRAGVRGDPRHLDRGDHDLQHRRRRPGLHLPGQPVRRHARHRRAGADVHRRGAKTTKGNAPLTAGQP